MSYAYHVCWLADTCPPSGALRDVMYLGAAALTDKLTGDVIFVAGRFAFLGCGPCWLEPFRNDYTSAQDALGGFLHLAREWEHALPYRR